MFADYRVPQILRHLNILTYSEHLGKLVDGNVEMAYSSGEEICIRAATVIAVEMIMAKIKE